MRLPRPAPLRSSGLAISLALLSAVAGAGLSAPAATHAQTSAPSAAPSAANRPHKLVIQVSDAEPAKWNLALNNARNVQNDLGRDKVAIEIVAHGPGIGLLKMDSVAATRVAEAVASGVSVVACENTMTVQKLARADMLPNVGYVASGVVQLMQRQREGYAYIRP